VSITAGRDATGMTLWPYGAERPAKSSLSARAHKTASATVTLTLGTKGRIALYNRAGEAAFVLAVEGYYSPPPSEAPRSSLTPTPILQGAPRP
jgi:hypothetical protein